MGFSDFAAALVAYPFCSSQEKKRQVVQQLDSAAKKLDTTLADSCKSLYAETKKPTA